MAHLTARPGQCLQHSLGERRLQLPHQLTSLRTSPLIQKPSVRWQHSAAVTSGVAVPMPPAQPDSPVKRLQRNGSEGLARAGKLLRSLSNKFASAPESTVQQVSAPREAFVVATNFCASCVAV